MVTVILVVHLLLALAMVGLILMQRSEGGALGMGGGSGGGGGGGFMSGRATADLLTRGTAILATSFFITSMVLAIISGQKNESKSILDQPAPVQQQPATPTGPSAPVAQ